MFKHKRLKRYHLSNTFFLVVALVILAMGIGYAAISTTLEIDGTSDIDSASWDVHFNNVQVTTGSVSATTPTISNNTSVSFSANLANPGDFYEFTVDVVNSGTLDAKLDGITILPVLTQAQQNYFKYTVTYESGLSIETNDALAAGTSKKIFVRCEYLVQSDTSLYPTDDTNFNFSVSMTYIQGHGIDRRFVYTTNDFNNPLSIGETIPSTIQTYNNYRTAMAVPHAINPASPEQPVFLGHYTVDGTIMESYICFEIGDKFYLLKGGDGGSSYTSNKEIIQSIFGIENCTQQTDYYRCTSSTLNIRTVRITTSGYVSATHGLGGCDVYADGSSSCDY